MLRLNLGSHMRPRSIVFLLGLFSLFPSRTYAVDFFLTNPGLKDCLKPAGLYYLRPQFTWRGEFFRKESRERAKAYFESLLKPVPKTDFDKILQTKIEDVRSTGIEEIDALYVINLKQRTEKWENTLRQLRKWGLQPTRFEAIYGKEVPVLSLQRLGLLFEGNMTSMPARRFSDEGLPIEERISRGPYRWLRHGTSFGAVGCLLSHLSIMQHAYDQDLQRIWIMEDDVQILRDPHEIALRINELNVRFGKTGWDILYTDKDMLNNDTGEYSLYRGFEVRPDLCFYNDPLIRKPINEHLLQCGARFGTHSFVITRSGLHKVLWFYKMFGAYCPIDHDLHYVPGIREFCVSNDLVTNLPFSVHDTGHHSSL